jgi:transcriptional regulator with XRE-family HTH domain
MPKGIDEVRKALRDARLKKGMTLKDVAVAVGVSEATISRWESGDIENMRRDKIKRLADALSLSPAVIMGYDEQSDEVDRYYTNPDTARIAQEIYEDSDMRLLFDAAQDAKPEDLKLAADMLKRLKGVSDE